MKLHSPEYWRFRQEWYDYKRFGETLANTCTKCGAKLKRVVPPKQPQDSPQLAVDTRQVLWGDLWGDLKSKQRQG